MLSSVDWAEKSLVVFIERLDFIVGNYTFRPGMKREDPPNLSILLSGGKEINEDCLSSGERSGKSSSRIRVVPTLNCNLKVIAKGEAEA